MVYQPLKRLLGLNNLPRVTGPHIGMNVTLFLAHTRSDVKPHHVAHRGAPGLNIWSPTVRSTFRSTCNRNKFQLEG